MAIKVFNGFPVTLKINSSDPKKFKANLKNFFILIRCIQWRNFLIDECFPLRKWG
jgi:hypothetical protein